MIPEPKIIRTYMSLPKQIDPAHILTMADLDLSFALASTLVEWDDSRQPVGALSDKWDFPKSNVIRFHIRGGVKWSNGDQIFAKEVLASFERAKKKYPDELQSLFDIIVQIRCPNDETIEFETKNSIGESNILRKLTEPMYGLVDTEKGGNISLSRSSGPFIVNQLTSSELTLTKNKNWFKGSDKLADRIELRPPSPDADLVTQFAKDSWANMVSSNSLQSAQLLNEFKAQNFEIWQRSHDKVFFLSPSPNFIKDFGTRALKSIGQQIQVKKILPNIGGYTVTDQFFPNGYVLHNLIFKNELEKEVSKFGRALTVLLPATPSGILVKEDLPKEIERITGRKPNVILVKPNEVAEAKAKGNYDILAVNVAVDDPNFEGAMTFFFAGNAPLIPSGAGENNFIQKISAVKSLKKDEEKIVSMRSVISKATQEGFVAPLFHFSSLTLAKNGIDLSLVPLTKETIPFSQIRFK